MPRILRGTLLAILVLATPSALAASPKPAHPGCFLLMNLETGEVRRNDVKKCAKRMPPASSFKVPHALIALETGVVTSVDQVHTWDGTQHRLAMWNQDQTLDTAMRRSAVWVFQGTARKIGRERMEDWLKRFRYGTQDASGDITLFWLGGPLRISPDEQLDFMARLYRGQLPVRPEVLEAVKGTLVHGPDTVASVRDGINQGGPWKDGAVLSAKTGWYPSKDGDVTWLVGHVASANGGRHVFVSAVKSPAGKSPSANPALAAAIDSLEASGLL
ncbi:beta-lactamase class D [Myxococcus stipitatus DSM 14675]|uniref:Beta-lactamase n=1 Tax=Myxococcus stipitatus (strain DSM 14675 / JCM 12634 / Mx s8) TaxID=1278073 RepID=L7UHC9_MYXSD|nr:hydrolase [Myxococcus stipitatus]AGC48401.1 beta-lactamase class D [Myxococcus stipitatus DSM 14675]